MPDSPTFSYFISPSDTQLSSADSVWGDPLPLARPSSGKSLETIVTHGEYFEAIRSFFEQDGFHVLSRALSQRLNEEILSNDVSGIQIHLEKHGEFYHPARIVVDAHGQELEFVLNTAVSPTGEAFIDDEFHNLKRLNAEFPRTFLPEVYSFGQVTSAGGNSFKMFMAEWLQDYHEFHISRETSGNFNQFRVWDDRNGRYFLSPEQTLHVYRQAAAILTFYYNINTFEHISQWHHAAGDFVLRRVGNDINLKLITVRRYSPLFRKSTNQAAEDAGAEQILQALLIFFLKISFRVRLDRIDGVGDIVWSDPGAVQSTLAGVLEGLKKKSTNPDLPDAVDTCFAYYLSLCSPADLLELSDSILQTFAPEAPETHIIRQNLDEHLHLLHEAIKDFRPA